MQWEFLPCGAGFTINSVWSGSFLAARDLKGQGTVEVVVGPFPTCWELEAMDNRNVVHAEDGAKDENGDVYVRYVQRSYSMSSCASSLTFHCYVFSIRLPHSEMALSIKGDQDGEPVSLLNCPSYHASSPQRNRTAFSDKRTGRY